MSIHSSRSNNSSIISNNTKIQALDSVLQQSFHYLKGIVSDFEVLQSESENYKTQFEIQKQKCESESCPSAEALKKVIDTKNNIIGLVASTLTKLYETKNFDILTEAFKILYKSNTTNPALLETEKLSPIAESRACNEKLREDSLNEIESTPTGRISPIIQSKKAKCSLKLDCRDKKKCSENWSTPEKKVVKLSFPTPTRAKSGTVGSGRLRQARLNIVNVKQTHVVDLTSSPEFFGGLKTSRTENECFQASTKRVPTENDDTIQPSPTSESTMFGMSKLKTKESPLKLKRPKCLSLIKKENISNIEWENNENDLFKTETEMEHSINILNPLPQRFIKENKPLTPVKIENVDEDATHCDTALSGSLLQEDAGCDGNPTDRKLPEFAEPMYKEPTIRKKGEKRALPGWSCEGCKNFYGELYKDDPVMLAKKIEECSKHRGRHNPERPKTPPNYWNPRWNVPEDTEELNRMNNAV